MPAVLLGLGLFLSAGVGLMSYERLEFPDAVEELARLTKKEGPR